MKELSGKTALLTGASRGIGEAAARYLAQLGVNVVLTARSGSAIKAIADEIRNEGGNSIALECDVSRYDDVKAAVDRCVAEFGSLDILVNNAGVVEPISRITDSDPQAWGKVIDINLKGVYYGIRAAARVMTEQGSGVIINISSGAATGALEGWSQYCSSKAGALSLTKCAQLELSPDGIRVVGLSPGTVATQMQIDIKASGINPVSQLDPSVHISPLWVAKAIAYLATDDAREFDGADFSLRLEENRAKAGVG
ncbi:MAG: SDR family oxidoreductase [Rhizobiaceae bacterium]